MVYIYIYIAQEKELESINQSSLHLFEKKPLLTQTQEGCTIELRKRKETQQLFTFKTQEFC